MCFRLGIPLKLPLKKSVQRNSELVVQSKSAQKIINLPCNFPVVSIKQQIFNNSRRNIGRHYRPRYYANQRKLNTQEASRESSVEHSRGRIEISNYGILKVPTIAEKKYVVKKPIGLNKGVSKKLLLEQCTQATNSIFVPLSSSKHAHKIGNQVTDYGQGIKESAD